MKKYRNHILAAIVGVFLLLFYFDIIPPIKMPVRFIEVFVGRRVKATYVPFQVEHTYATTNNCGKNCNILKIYYEGQDETLIVTSIDEMGWMEDPKWKKNSEILNGANYYYSNQADIKKIEWQNEEKRFDLMVEYIGYRDLPFEKMVQIAENVQLGWQSEEEKKRYSF